MRCLTRSRSSASSSSAIRTSRSTLRNSISSRDLLEEGVIDSLALMELVEFLRQRFSVEFAPNEVVSQNFKTLDTIGTLVDRKLEGKG